MPRKPRTASEAAENAKPVGGEATEEPQVNVPAPQEQEETKDTKEEKTEDPQVKEKLGELEEVAKWLAEIDSKRARRKELIQTLQLMGCKNARIRTATGLSNAGFLNAMK